MAQLDQSNLLGSIDAPFLLPLSFDVAVWTYGVDVSE